MQTPVSAIMPLALPSGSVAPPSVMGDGSALEVGGWWQPNTLGVIENVAPPTRSPVFRSIFLIVSLPSGSTNVTPGDPAPETLHRCPFASVTSQNRGLVGSSE